jgi:hypothetical protein
MKPVRALVFFLVMGVLMVLLAAQGVAQASGVSTSVSTGSQRTLTVRAFIDGRSTLILRDNTVHWFHADYAAPGRHNGVNYPTYLNGTAWFPTWPDVPTRENRDCHCNSSTFVGVPRLPAHAQTVTLTIQKQRGGVFIVQQPNAGNNYTLKLTFNDDLYDGASWYKITLTYTS